MRPVCSQPSDTTHAFAGDSVLLFAPAAIRNRHHAHFAATWLIAVNAPFSLTLDGGETRQFTHALLAPNVQRTLDSHGEPIIDLLIDADCDAYRWLAPHLDGQPVCSPALHLPAELRTQCTTLLAGELDGLGARALVGDLLAALTPLPAASLPWDARVLAASTFIRERLPHTPVSLSDVAAKVELSGSRLRHLFGESFGLPVRQYLLWLRVRAAMRLWAQGAELTDIALGAGFYDQAHFSRTLRRMTGFAPSMLKNDRVIAQALPGW